MLAALVGQAKRPLLVAGGGVNRSGAGPALSRMAQRSGIPVVTTITGQNVMPDRDELAIGVIGDNGFHPHALRALEELRAHIREIVPYDFSVRVSDVLQIGRAHV